jgi:excisionase family DNA binding protein
MVHLDESDVKPRRGIGGDQMVDERLTVSVEEAGRLLGLSRNSAYEAARRGELPVLRFGKRLVVPRARLMAMLTGERQRQGQGEGA